MGAMGLSSGELCVTGYCRVMGYGAIFPADELRGSKILWVTVEYGLSQVWTISESTVPGTKRSIQGRTTPPDQTLANRDGGNWQHRRTSYERTTLQILFRLNCNMKNATPLTLQPLLP